MSFSRAPLKRFNDDVGCAPAPGTYEVKPGDVRGAASFHKAERFRPSKRDANVTLLPSPSKTVAMSPVRRTLSADGLAEVSSSKKDKTVFSAQMKQQKLLEKEIRMLVQQRAEQDRRLQVLEEELRRLEARLLAAVREKTGLAANVASLERQLAELRKVNEFLKSKVSADSSKKKINSLSMELIEARNDLDVKDKELRFLQISAEGRVKVLQTELEEARAALSVLGERSTALEDLHRDTKRHNEELETEMDNLCGVVQGLREETNALQGYLDTANEEIQELRVMRQDDSALAAALERLSVVEQTLEHRTAELQASQHALQQQEEVLGACRLELEATQNALGQQEQQERELARVREVLRRTEEELDQRVALLGERCLTLENERGRTQEEGFRRVRELQGEQQQLQQHNTELSQRLEEEMARCVSLTSTLQRVRVETASEQRQLEEELEEVLGELSALEAQEQCSEVAIQSLQQQQVALSDLRVQLERRCEELSAVEESHTAAMTKLQEEHSSALRRLGDAGTELEGCRQAFSAEREQMERRVQEAQEELRRAAQQLQEERESHLALQHTHDQTQQESSRMLLEVQTKLAQMEELLRRCEEAHGTERSNAGVQPSEEAQRSAERLEQENHSLQRQTEQLQQEVQELQRRREEEVQELQRGHEEEVQELQRRREEEVQELQRRREEEVQDLERSPDTETEHWRTLYEELFAKVRPFQEQLDGFAAERAALLSEQGSTQEELRGLADAYARLLGHQNQKQKIKHVIRLKEENLQLKQEVSKLRLQVGKQKRELEQTLSNQAPRRFDPSKAFSHAHKENTAPAATLRQGNSGRL